MILFTSDRPWGPLHMEHALKSSPLLVSETGRWVMPTQAQLRTDSRGGWNARATLGRTLRIRDDDTLAQLWQAVETAAQERKASTLMLPGGEGELGTLVTVRPAREPGFAVVVLDSFGTPPPPPSAQFVADLLGITPSESEVVLGLLEGMSIVDIAGARGTSVDTVRGHVKSVLRKTDLPSQKHLMALLSRVATMAARSAGRSE